ncbi:MAG TPA: Fe-S cluster assembly transcription factor [Gammaproteobacteria bacterium]|nr:Fe-S cluster assembly transcription factor [Gammaproteobacteria bacterium]
MRLSTKGRYAVTAMMDLALRAHQGPVTLADISSNQGISNSYLEQLFSRLRKNGLVTGVRGPRGGYRLARGAHEITVADIISAVDESVDATRCRGKENCQDGERCLTHELWMELSASLFDFLDSITLAQYVNRPVVQDVFTRREALAGSFAGADEQHELDESS